MGILGDPSKLNIAADGTYMPTQASPHGKKFHLYIKEGQNNRLDQSHSIELAAYGFF